MMSGTAMAHSGEVNAAGAWWYQWHLDAWVIASLCFWTIIYLVGWRRMWVQARRSRSLLGWRAVAFSCGMATLGVALLSPVDTFGNELSWVHMTQHMLLMIVAAPMIVVGAPGLLIPWTIPARWRKPFAWRLTKLCDAPLGRLLWNPVFVWSLYGGVMWVWHLPLLYELALRDPWVHDIEHLSFFVTAFLFWRVVLDSRSHRRLNPAVSVLYLFTTSLHSMLLGVLMALSPTLWYEHYRNRPEAWGLTPLEDQQLAGLIMWMPGCAIYGAITALWFAAWLESSEQLSEEPRNDGDCVLRAF